MEKIKLSLPVIVEGKYDKITLSSVIDAHIVQTDGFGIFNNKEKRALISRISKNGVIVMCDSDSAGGVIRSCLNGIVPKDKQYPLYIPRISGKERRKATPSKEGLLGVEGMSADTLRGIIEAFVSDHPEAAGGEAVQREPITKMDFYEAGLSGGEGASAKRDELARSASLPEGMTSGALLAALNIIMSRDEFLEVVSNQGEKG